MTQEDFDEAGPEFYEDYMGGVYDVACHECKGNRVVPVPDFARLTDEEKKAWRLQVQEEADTAAIYEAERRAGA